MKFPRVAYFSIDSQGWYRSRVFWNQKEEDEWLEKYGMKITDVIIIEANEEEIKTPLAEDEFIVCEEPEDPECYPDFMKEYKPKEKQEERENGRDKRVPKE